MFNNKLKNIDINKIQANVNQPRTVFNEAKIDELAASIKENGLIQPIVVRKNNGVYQIIAGERRYRACRLLNMKQVPCIIEDYTDKQTQTLAIIENIQREDLNPIEEAKAYQRLIKDYRLKQDEVAEKVSKSRAAITNSLRLLKLDERVQDMVMEGKISSGHARTIISIEDKDKQYMIAQKIFDEKLSVREVEKLMKTLDAPEKKEKKLPANDFVYRDLEQKLKNIMGTQVIIKNKSNNKGKIEIDYYSQAELERIYDLLKKINE